VTRLTDGPTPASPALSATPTPMLVVPDLPLEQALHTFWLLALLRVSAYGEGLLASVTRPTSLQDAWVRLGRN